MSGFDNNVYSATTNVDVTYSMMSSMITDLLFFVPVVSKIISSNIDMWMRSNDILFAKSLWDMANSRENWLIYCKYRNKAKSVIRRERRKHYLDPNCLWRVHRKSGCTNDDDLNFDCDIDSVLPAYVI